MRLSLSMLVTYAVGLQFAFIFISVIAQPWCHVPMRRNWRFPPTPPPRPPPPLRRTPSPSKPRRPPIQLISRFPPPQNLPGRPLIALYLHENHKGFKYEQFVGQRCYNLPNVINDKASSLDTNGRCVMVCKDRDCQRCKKMKPGSRGHFILEDIGMDDEITSLKPCGDIYEL